MFLVAAEMAAKVFDDPQYASVQSYDGTYDTLSAFLDRISIHWHGQHQINTNFMDGVGLVTQCPIQPGSSFRYIFRANPSGTFWYHSHMGSQRAYGLFGALIVKEMNLHYPIAFRDDPASHTMTLMDWYEQEQELFF